MNFWSNSRSCCFHWIQLILKLYKCTNTQTSQGCDWKKLSSQITTVSETPPHLLKNKWKMQTKKELNKMKVDWNLILMFITLYFYCKRIHVNVYYYRYYIWNSFSHTHLKAVGRNTEKCYWTKIVCVMIKQQNLLFQHWSLLKLLSPNALKKEQFEWENGLLM